MILAFKRLFKQFVILFFALSVLITYGCKTTSLDYFGRCEPYNEKEIETLLEDILKTQGLDAFSAIAQAQISNESGRHFVKLAILLKKPSYLRVEAIPVLGPVPFFLAIREGTLKLFLPQKNEFYIAKATSANIEALLFPISEIEIHDLISILAGGLTASKMDKISLKECKGGKYLHVDILGKEGKIQTLYIDPVNKRIVKMMSLKDDKPLYSVEFEEFDNTQDNQIMPLKVSIMKNDVNQAGVVLRYSSVNVIQDIDSDMFDLPIPENIRPVYLK